MSTEKKLVVMVDDSSIDLRIGKAVLGRKYRVASMPSAKQLLAVLDKIDPALILLDVNMPEMSGFEALTYLKAKPQFRDIPVIFITGRGDEEDRFTGLALGAADYITKPYESSMLLKKIETHLAKQKKRVKVGG